MFLKFALVVLGVWLLGLIGVYQIGNLYHVFLLVGFMLLLLGFLRARDEALQAAAGEPKKTS